MSEHANMAAADLDHMARLREERDALYVLYEDVQRWRDGGGDDRDLRYILDTMDGLEARYATSAPEQALIDDRPLAPAPSYGDAWPAQRARIIERLRAKNPDHPWVREEESHGTQS
jgi:hypothetical protein